MDTYEAKHLLADSLRCLARCMEQIRLREIEKVVGNDEVMQDHLAQCTWCRVPYDDMSVEDCCDYLTKLYRGFEEASNHEIETERKFSMGNFEIAHICDMINNYIGHGYPDNLVDCAREIWDMAQKIMPAKCAYEKSETLCNHVVGCFLKRAEKIIKEHGYKNWEDGEYSLTLGYLGSWMKQYYWKY